MFFPGVFNWGIVVSNTLKKNKTINESFHLILLSSWSQSSFPSSCSYCDGLWFWSDFPWSWSCLCWAVVMHGLSLVFVLPLLGCGFAQASPGLCLAYYGLRLCKGFPSHYLAFLRLWLYTGFPQFWPCLCWLLLCIGFTWSSSCLCWGMVVIRLSLILVLHLLGCCRAQASPNLSITHSGL